MEEWENYDRKDLLECAEESGVSDGIRTLFEISMKEDENIIFEMNINDIEDHVDSFILLSTIKLFEKDYLLSRQTRKYNKLVDKSNIDFDKAENFPEDQLEEIKELTKLLNSQFKSKFLDALNFIVYDRIIEDINEFFDFVSKKFIIKLIEYGAENDESFEMTVTSMEECLRQPERFLKPDNPGAKAIAAYNKYCLRQLNDRTLFELRFVAKNLGVRNTNKLNRGELCSSIMEELDL